MGFSFKSEPGESPWPEPKEVLTDEEVASWKSWLIGAATLTALFVGIGLWFAYQIYPFSLKFLLWTLAVAVVALPTAISVVFGTLEDTFFDAFGNLFAPVLPLWVAHKASRIGPHKAYARHSPTWVGICCGLWVDVLGFAWLT